MKKVKTVIKNTISRHKNIQRILITWVVYTLKSELCIERFSIKCRKTNHKETDNTMDQSKLKDITRGKTRASEPRLVLVLAVLIG